MYPRWPLKNFRCGFCAMMPCARGLVSAPSPPEVIEVPTNSVPTVGEFGSLKSAFQVGRPVVMHVSRDNDRVGDAALRDEIQDPVAGAQVPVPSVHGERFIGAAPEISLGEKDLLG